MLLPRFELKMTFAFATECCPAWDLDTVFGRATEYGYDGVELSAGSGLSADVPSVRAAADGSGVRVACVRTSADLGETFGTRVRAAVEVAHRLACRIVRVPAGVRPRDSAAAAALQLAAQLPPLGDFAAARGVTLVVENSTGFARARDLWLVAERASHPAVAVAWDLLTAAAAGEFASVSVPTLNHRIRHAIVHDAVRSGDAGLRRVRLGDGDLRAREFVTRLRGIGYAGWVTVGGPRPGDAGAEDYLRDAITKLRAWSEPHRVSDVEFAAVGEKPLKNIVRPPGKPATTI